MPDEIADPRPEAALQADDEDGLVAEVALLRESESRYAGAARLAYVTRRCKQASVRRSPVAAR